MSKSSRTDTRPSAVQASLVTFAVVAFALFASASEWGGSTEHDSVVVTATQAAAQGAPVQGVSVPTRVEEWLRSPACRSTWYRYDLDPRCISAQDTIIVTCADGSRALNPWWMRFRLTSGAWSGWSMVSWYQCPTDLLRAAIESAWARMPIAPNTITVQPGTGWVLTTVPTVVFVDRNARTMTTTLLGTSVRIRATASAYTWTWGDGSSPTVTTQPGAAFPNQTVSHTYMYREGPVTITLATTWRGSYSTNGGATWSTAPGTARTTSVPVTVTVYNPHGHRVDCDLNGTCLSGADGPAEEE